MKNRILAAIVLSALAVMLCACGLVGGLFDGFSGKQTTTAPALTSGERSLLAYAKELEQNGNPAAAAAVYAVLPEALGAAEIQKAHADVPIIRTADEMNQLGDLVNALKGGAK